MKKIKVNFVDFFDDFNPTDNQFLYILKQRYQVEISDTPDYLFYSCFGMNHLKYHCVRIFYTGECVTPDFNECDYAIGFDRLLFNDRYIRVPLYYMFQYKTGYNKLLYRSEFTKEDLARKTGFCSFVYSNCFADDKRSQMFDILSQYSRVDSGGRYKNNIGRAVDNKLLFQQNYKFSIAFENTVYPGYCTEKLMEAFEARTIPIYFGDPEIGRDFNKKAFINVQDYGGLYGAAKKVIDLDHDDQMYIAMQNEAPVINTFSDNALPTFLYNIIDQDVDHSFRRPLSQRAKASEARQLRYQWFDNNIYRNFERAKNICIRLRKNTMISWRRKR